MMLGNLQCRGVRLIWIIVEQGPTVFALDAGKDCLVIFFSLFSFFLSLRNGRI